MTIDLRDLFPQEEGKFTQVLLKALNKASDTSFDYLKFKSSIKQLESMGMDQEQAIKSTFATASTMGINKKALIKSSKYYAMVLEKEKRHFAEALVNQQKERINNKNENLGTFAKEVNLNKNKIEQLQKEITTYQKKIDQLKIEIESEASKIDETRGQFMDAYTKLKETIDSDSALFDELL